MHENNIDPTKPQTIFTDLTVVDSIYENLTTDGGEDKLHPFRGTGSSHLADRESKAMLDECESTSHVSIFISFFLHKARQKVRNWHIDLDAQLHLSLYIALKCAERLITDAFADLLPVTRLKTVEMLDILQRTFQHMDTGLRRALRLGNDEDELKKEIDKVIL